MKLMEFHGRRPLFFNKSDEPAKRVASSPVVKLSTPSLFWLRRMVSRNLSFHSDQPDGKLPTWYVPPPIAQGSAIKATPGRSRARRLSAVFGSSLSKLKQPCSQVLPSTEARSKRKPSTPNSSRHQASESTIRSCATGLTVL